MPAGLSLSLQSVYASLSQASIAPAEYANTYKFNIHNNMLMHWRHWQPLAVASDDVHAANVARVIIVIARRTMHAAPGMKL